MAECDELLVVYAFLDSLAANARTSAEALASGSTLIDLQFTRTPEITNAYRSFLDAWDEHRGGLHDGVAAAADAFETTSAAFCELEQQLIAALAGDTPGT